MKTYFTLLLLLSFNFFTLTFSQIPPPESFFPSAVGNVWEFDTDHGFVRREIVKDSIGADSSKYLFLALNTEPIYKIDSILNVYWFDFDKYKIYKLGADSGETWISDTRFNTIARVDNIFQSYIFGKLRYVKDIGYYRPAPGDTTITDSAEFESDTWLVSGVGEYYEFRAEEGLRCSY